MQKIVCLVATALIAVCAMAQSTGYLKIDAQYLLTGGNYIDPPQDQKKDRVALFLSGVGAKAIYDAMPSSIENAEICEEGLKLKTSGGLVCAHHDGSSYSCSVAIMLKSGETKAAGSC